MRCRSGLAGRVVAVGVMVAWVAALPGWALAVAPTSQVPPQPTLRGSAVVADLAAGRSFDRSGVRIIGDVDLRRLQAVRVALRCYGCTLQGALLARDVRFTDPVDLSGTTVTGRVDLRGAIFGRGLAWRNGVIDGMTTAGLAVFRDVMDANGLVFRGTADFSDAHFKSAANFAATDFHGPAIFDGATFGAAATFTAGISHRVHPAAEPNGCSPALAGAFAADASFIGATFAAAADFLGRCFHGRALFSDAIVRGSATFDDALFLHVARFENATVAGNLSYRAAQFMRLADLKGVAVGADLRFDQAVFQDSLWLTTASVSGTLSFLLATPGGALQADGLSAGGLVLDPANISWVAGPTDQILLLQHVETTARATGQTGLANEARYAWLSEAGDQHGIHDMSGILDRLFYRYIAGYLVRPWRPVLTLVIVILAGIAVNAVVTRRRHRRTQQTEGRDPASPPAEAAGDQPTTDPQGATDVASAAASPRRLRGLRARAGRSARRLPDRLSRAGKSVGRVGRPILYAAIGLRPGRATSHDDAPLILTSFEYLAGKALLVASLMCVANASPALHQFIDSLLSMGSKP